MPSIIDFGFLFIWCEKELTAQVLKLASSWDFRYVENFTWVKKNLDNRISVQPSRYINRSKSTCLIFRKAGEIEIRHQRNPDCDFDFIQPEDLSMQGERRLVEAKPSYIFEIIETLLPGSSNKLIEL